MLQTWIQVTIPWPCLNNTRPPTLIQVDFARYWPWRWWPRVAWLSNICCATYNLGYIPYSCLLSTTKVHGIYRPCFNKIDRVRQEFLHFADIWGTHSWSNRVLRELWGLILTNAYFTSQSFYPETFKGLSPQQFKEQIAWQMIQNPFLASEGVQRPIGILTTAKHRMVRMPARKKGKANFTDTSCRYCKKNTTWRCATCSDEKHFFGICYSAARGCMGRHTAGDVLPKRKAHRWKKNMVMEQAMVVHTGSN